MNHTYRLIWNEAAQAWVAVAEFVRACGKRSGAVLLAAAALASSAHALPTGGVVSAGAGTVSQSGATMTVNQSSQNLAVNWQSFNIDAPETVNFVQPNAAAIALNRVLGTDGSQILGKLNANGQVWILNPNGVLFGQGAQVNVGGLVASTLNLSDADFLAGKRTFAGSGGNVTNQGKIAANYVALLGEQVSNEGAIVARVANFGTVTLAAGNKITLDFDGDKLLGVQVAEGALHALVENKNLIQADGGLVVMTAKAKDALLDTAVNNTGIVRARTIENRKGKILLLGDMQSGTANVGGTLDASAPESGDGGFIETSAAKVGVGGTAHVTTKSTHGRTGTWLIDPNDFTIAASGGNMTGDQVETALASNNFEISTATMGTAGGNGDIHVNDAITWSANTLTLTAERDININAMMAANDTAGLTMTTGGSGAVNVGITDSGFTGRVDFFQADDITPRAGAGFLTINGIGYTVITDLGAAGSTTGADLQGMNGGLAGHYALGANIDAADTANWNSGAGFNPVGNSTTKFTGAFDGLGHTVDGLFIDRSTSDVGLFGMTNGAELGNVGLAGVDVTTSNAYAGGLLGRGGSGSSIRNSYATGAVTGTGGGIVSGFGLLAGFFSGDMIRCHASGDVGGNYYVGGLVGHFESGATIGDSHYAGGNLTGTSYVGGLVGHRLGAVSNSHYAIDATRINGVDGVATRHGVYAGQFADWLAGGRAALAVGGYFSADGDGSYLVDSAQKLKYLLPFAETGGLKFRLAADLALPAGYMIPVFAAAEFDGGGHTLSGLAIDLSGNGGVDAGFIGELAAGATVRDLRLADVAVTGGSSSSTGGLVGYNKGAVDNVGVSGTVSRVGLVPQTSDGSGGLAGYNTITGAIDNSYATVAVSGAYYLGGLVGSNAGAIGTSYAAGNVAGTNNYVGGLAGRNAGAISDSYAAGSVSGSSNVGGLVGDQPVGSITRGYATGAVSGSSSVGGLVGSYLSGSVTNSLWDTQTTGRATSAGGAGAVGKTTAQMKTLATYAAWGANIDDTGGSGTTWRIYDGYTYPLLRGFLTALNVQPDYDGSGAALTNIGAVTPVGAHDAGKVFTGSLHADTLTLSSTALDSYTATSTANNLYSGQTGYDLVPVARSIAADSAAGDIVLTNPITWTSGTLAIDTTGTITQTAAINGTGTAIFDLQGGTWSQIDATLPAFAAYDFRISGGTFVRALSGDGTVGTPYQLADIYGLQGMGSSGMLGLNYALANDVDASATTNWWAGAGFVPVGGDAGLGCAACFTGSFDGGYHTIDRLFIDRHATNTVGFFGNAYATIANVGLTNADVTGDLDVGGLVGLLDNATVSNSYVTGAVQGGTSVGGLVGSASASAVSGSYATATVNGSSRAGGLVGSGDHVTISKSYATGSVSGTGSVGGLIGDNHLGSVTASYWDTQTSGRATSDGGTGKTTAQMKTLSTFSGWDIDDAGGTGKVWRIYDGYTTPLLRGFLTALNVTPDYDGSSAALGNIGAYTIGGAYDAGQVLGAADRLTLTSTAANAYTATVKGLYSTQLGYDLVSSRSIATPGSAAGDIALTNPIAWSSGTLAIDATGGTITPVVINGAGTAIFDLQGGWWEQVAASLPAFAAYDFRVSGGTFIRALAGDGAAPFQLVDVYGLQGMGAITMSANSFVLAGDIDAAGTANWNAGAGFKPVGDSGTPFIGGFDGQGHVIDGLFIDRPTTDYVGLFGVAGNSIANVGLSNADITGQDRVGGIAGQLDDTQLNGSYVAGSVSGRNYVGGAVGYSNFGAINNSYATASVAGTDTVGGLVGRQLNDPVTHSYATGAVSGTTNVGGLIGSGTGAASNSFWDTQATGQSASAGGAGAVGKTTAQMQQLATYAAWGVNIDDTGGSGAVWRIYDGYTYPLLRGFLTPLNVTPDYDGSGAALANVAACTIGGAYDAGQVLGAAGATLTLTSTAANAYTATVKGLYSTQLGYDLVSSRSIATPGSASGDIALTTPITWTSGTLAINTAGTVTQTAAINGTGTAIFDLQGGTWSQIAASLPAFAAYDFRISGGSFIRALSGDGTVGTPYQLTDIYGIQGMGSSGMLGLHYALANDVDASGTANWWAGTGFAPVGGSIVSGCAACFTGSFDGQGHAIDQLFIDRPTTDYVGLFGGVLATIDNVRLTNATVTGNWHVGGLAAALDNGTVSNSYVTGSVQGGDMVGGLVGLVSYSEVSGSYATAAVTGSGASVGGLAAKVEYGTISNSYATGAVSGNGLVGGLVGEMVDNNISKSYATGSVSGTSNVGGLVGYRSTGTVTASFWDTQTTGQATSAGGAGAVGKTTAQMKSLATFAGWDIDDAGSTGKVWRIYEGQTAPLLRGFLTPLTVTANNATKTYDGNPYSGGSASYSVAPDPNLLGAANYGGNSQGAVNVGSYVITPSGFYSNQRGHDISYANGTLTIDPVPIVITGLGVGADNKSKVYGSADPALTWQVTSGTLAHGDTLSGSLVRDPGENTGGYAIRQGSLTAGGNYAISFANGILTITPAPLTVTAHGTTKTYDGLGYSGGNGVSYSGFVNGETAAMLGGVLAYGGDAQGAKNAGSYAITPAGLTSGNYAIAYAAGTLTVLPATLTVTANDASKTYDGLAFGGGNGVAYSGFVNGETVSVLGGALVWGGTAQGTINAGSYTIAPGGLTSGNYAIGYADGALTVNKAPLVVTANDAAKTYDGLAYAGGNGLTYAGFVNGETASALGGALAWGGTAQGAINAGGYTIAPGGLTSGNYAIGYADGTLTVNKAPLVVTANDAAKTYDGLAYAGGNGLTYAGFVNGEIASALGGALAWGGTAQGASYGGSRYVIAPAGLTSANYALAYVDGELTIRWPVEPSGPGAPAHAYAGAIESAVAGTSPGLTVPSMALLSVPGLPLVVEDCGQRLPPGVAVDCR